MPFEKGHKLATGRKKGSENKETKKLRDWLGILMDDNFERFKKEMNKLTGKDYIIAYTQLLEYSTPKLNRTEFTGDMNVNAYYEVGVEDE